MSTTTMNNPPSKENPPGLENEADNQGFRPRKPEFSSFSAKEYNKGMCKLLNNFLMTIESIWKDRTPLVDIRDAVLAPYNDHCSQLALQWSGRQLAIVRHFSIQTIYISFSEMAYSIICIFMYF